MADDVRSASDAIARLLEEVRGMAGPSTWGRVEELMRQVLALYGAGLERVLALASEAGAGDAALADRLAADELVSSLLLLHGLHPVPARERVARALAALHERLGDGVMLELSAMGADGVVRVRVGVGPDQRCGFSAAALRRTVEQAVVEAAPEVAGVAVDGLGAAAGPEPLVSIGRPRAAAGVDG